MPGKISQSLLIIIFLILGLYKSPDPDAHILTLLLTTYCGYVAFKSDIGWKIIFTVVVALIFTFMIKVPIVILGTSFLIMHVLVQFIAFKTKTYLVLTPILGLFILLALPNQGALSEYLKTEPASESYANDADYYLKTYYLTAKTHHYYSSLETAMVGHINHDTPEIVVWAWRPPVLTWVWVFLTGGVGQNLYWVNLVTCLLLLISAYVLSNTILKSPKPIIPLLSVYLLIPYLLVWVSTKSFLLTEWWGLLPFCLTVIFLIKKRYLLALLMAIITVSLRELYIWPMVILGASSILWGRWKVMLVCLAVGLYFIQAVNVHTYLINLQSQGRFPVVFHRRVHEFSTNLVSLAITYHQEYYLFDSLSPLLIFFTFAMVQYLIYPSWERLLPTSILVIPALMLRIGQGEWNAYWGILFMPIVLILAPWVIRNTKHLLQ